LLSADLNIYDSQEFMEKITDWNALWRDLVEIKEHSRKMKGHSATQDIWANRAQDFKEGVKRKWARPDSSREFILSRIDSNATVLDIGAGTGAWSILMAPRAKHVTAVEPSNSMIEVMRESLAAENINNVSIVRGEWPDVTVESHDYSLCSHAMYACTDLRAFILRMAACTRRMCFLVLRAPAIDSVRAEAAGHLWGQPLDSPNFTIAYNVLLQAGIYANVLMENTGLWKPRTSPGIIEALGDMRRFLGLGDSGEHDEYLLDLLRRRLIWKDGKYFWPPEVRSALVYWQVESG
jgi:2-polyprenyl-3-methyl-5-hydroxy-6-metoxy-1,4-benzoquinol methylase